MCSISVCADAIKHLVSGHLCNLQTRPTLNRSEIRMYLFPIDPVCAS